MPWVAAAFLACNCAKLFLFNRTLARGAGARAGSAAIALGIAAAWELLIGAALVGAGRGPWLGAFWLAQLAYLALNVGYFRYYNSYLSFRQALSLLGEFKGIAQQGAVPLPKDLALYLIDLPALLALVLLGPAAAPSPGIPRLPAAAAALCLLAALYGLRLAGPAFRRGEASGRDERARLVASVGLLPLQLRDALSRADHERQISPERLPLLSGQGRADARSVLLVQVESLDANVLEARHRGCYVMPFLRSLISRGLFVPFMLSYHKGGGTSDAEFSALTSVEPLDDYAAFNIPGYGFPNSLPRAFREAGFRVEAFHGNVGRYWNRKRAFASMGFERYWSREESGLPESGWGAKDEDLLDFVAGRIEGEAARRFDFVLTMSSHGPYTNVRRYYSDPRLDGMPAGMEREYFLSMAYVDQALERFLARLGPRLGETVVGIYGDHSEYYVPEAARRFPRGCVRDGPRRLEFVPFFLFGPGVPEGKRREAAALGDIAPTVLAASGIPYSIRSIGTDLLDARAPAPAVPVSGRGYPREELAALARSSLGSAAGAP